MYKELTDEELKKLAEEIFPEKKLTRQQKRQLDRKKKKKTTYNYSEEMIIDIKEKAIGEAVAESMIYLFAMPLKIMKREFGWSSEELAWMFDQIQKEYINFSEGNMTPQQYAKWVYDEIGMKFEVDK